MKVLAILFFSLPVFASKPPLTCETCLKAESLIRVWDKAKSSPEKTAALQQTQGVMQKLASEIHKAPTDEARVRATVRLLSELYVHNMDPLDEQLEAFRSDFQKPQFRSIFEKEYNKLPKVYRDKLMVGLMAFKAAPDLDADPQ
jgi:hypothetical protein